MLTKPQHKENIEFFQNILSQFGDRSENLKKLYDSFGEYLYTAPASSIVYYHNAFPGGYVDHVIRVMKFSKETYNLYEKLGLIVGDFSLEELLFSALNHDLGKLGFPGEGNQGLLPQDSKWHKDTLGQLYKFNTDIPYATVPDKTLFLLQKFGIPYSLNEFYAMKLHDGLYEEANKTYYISRAKESKLRTNIPFILHFADMMASRYEYEQVCAKDFKSFNI